MSYSDGADSTPPPNNDNSEGVWSFRPAPAAAPHDYAPGWYMPAAAPVQQRRRRWPWVVSLLSGLLVLALGGGAFAAYQAFSGGGAQPESAVPADALAFAKVDFDPSGTQKIAAFQFLRHIPDLAGKLKDGTDPREALFDAYAKATELPADLSFATDVKPWLGMRPAVALRPALVRTHAPDALIIVQVSDQAKARAGTARLSTRFSDTMMGISFQHDYAILAENQDMADRASKAAANASLGNSQKFRADMKAVGPAGVASGWGDIGALSKLSGASTGMFGAAPFGSAVGGSGRSAYAVRFTSTSAEAIIKTFDGKSKDGVVAAIHPSLLATLPVSTAAAFEGTSANRDQQWADVLHRLNSQGATGGFSVDHMLAGYERLLGIKLPADAETLLGTDLVVSVDSADLSRSPKIAARSKTDGAGAVEVLEKIRTAMTRDGLALPFTWTKTSDGVVASNDPVYLQTIASPTGAALSSLDSFDKALPDLQSATAAGFVNLEDLTRVAEENGASAQELSNLKVFSAVGFTAAPDATGTMSRIRLLLR